MTDRRENFFISIVINWFDAFALADENLSRLLKRHLIFERLFDFLESYQLYFDINNENNGRVLVTRTKALLYKCIFKVKFLICWRFQYRIKTMDISSQYVDIFCWFYYTYEVLYVWMFLFVSKDCSFFSFLKLAQWNISSKKKRVT